MENSKVILGYEIREESSAGRSQRPLRKKIKRFTRCNVRAYSDQERKQQFNMTPPCHAVFKLLVQCLLGLVAVKFQAISEDPFETHSIQSWSFLAAILMYSLILLAMKQSPSQCNEYLEILCRVALAFEVISSLSLISLLLQHFPGLVLIYNSWAIFFIISALTVLRCTYNLLLTGKKTVHNYLIRFALFRGWNFGQEPPPQVTRPPVSFLHYRMSLICFMGYSGFCLAYA